MGTIGGSVANNDPAADYPAAILGARRDRSSPTSARSPADEFFTGLFETALEDGRDHHQGVVPDRRRRRAYEKFRNPASRYAMTGVFVAQVEGRR
jgi:CO/xanthine dehydrogenase FAD-binding subunit